MRYTPLLQAEHQPESSTALNLEANHIELTDPHDSHSNGNGSVPLQNQHQQQNASSPEQQGRRNGDNDGLNQKRIFALDSSILKITILSSLQTDTDSDASSRSNNGNSGSGGDVKTTAASVNTNYSNSDSRRTNHRNNAEHHSPCCCRSVFNSLLATTWRHWVGVSISVLPLLIFAVRASTHRWRPNQVFPADFAIIAATCAGLGAVLFGSVDYYDDRYWLARFMGGTTSSISALCIMIIVLSSISHEADTNVAPFLLVGILGVMPGIVVYYLIRIMSDECCRERSLWAEPDDNDEEVNYGTMYRPLTDGTEVHKLDLDVA